MSRDQNTSPRCRPARQRKGPMPGRSIAWGGFVDSRLCGEFGKQYGYSSEPVLVAVFTKRKDARERYEDVRKVEITWKRT